MKYRKKPIVIEAYQMTKVNRWNNFNWPQWMHIAWNMKPLEEGAIWINQDDPKKEKLICGTLEGVYHIDLDDWVIQGIKGEIYPCKPDIFKATYDAVTDGAI